MSKYNIIRVLYAPGETVAVAPQAYAHNSGQILEIYGLPCDDQAVKMSFAAEGDETAVPVVADVTGGVLSVSIPDSVLSGTGRNYKARAYFHIVETGAVTTKYTVIIPVIDEPEMADEEPTPEQAGEIDSLIVAMNSAVDAAEQAAGDAETAAQAVQDMGATAETLEAGADATVEKEVDAGGTVTLRFGIPRGDTGAAGPKGETGERGPQGERGPAGATGADGFSPVVATVEIENGTRVQITDARGTHSFDVMNAEGYFTTKADEQEIFSLYNQSAGTWTNSGNEMPSFKAADYTFHIDGTEYPVHFTREQRTLDGHTAWCYTGSAGGVTVTYYYSTTYRARSTVEFDADVDEFIVTETDGYIVDVKDGYTAGESLKGEKGETGETGPQGIQGETGPAGPAGPTGPQGPAYTLTAADKAAIVAAIEADYDNGDTSAYGS